MSAAGFFDSARALKRELTGDPAVGLNQDEVDALNVIIGGWKPVNEPKEPTELSNAGEFFKAIRASFGPFTQTQVDGFGVLLQAFGAARWPLAWTAYGLATAWHETAKSMQPVEEAYYLGSKGDAYRKTLRYYPFFGRGYCQLTWQRNYASADEALELGGALLADASLALKPDIAARVIVWGMETGAFTGKSLKDYLPISGQAGFDAYTAARRIINGQDRAADIAKEAQAFEAALVAGGWA